MDGFRLTRRTGPAVPALLPVLALVPVLAGGCMFQQPLPRNQQPVLATPPAGRPNLNPVLSPTVIQDDASGRAPEAINSLPRGSEVNRPLTPQAGEINTIRVGPATR